MLGYVEWKRKTERSTTNGTMTTQGHLLYFTIILLQFYQQLLKEKSNPQLKGNRKGIIVKDKEFYIPILNTFPTR